MIRSSDRKKTFADFLAAYYHKQGFKDLTEPNELSLLSDFHSYNLDFAKDQLKLPDDKAALLMNILAPFISFKHLEKEGEGMWVKPEEWSEERCKEVAERKFDAFKETLLAFSADNPPVSLRVFSPAELSAILEYATKTYFRHFMLFGYALGTRQKVQEKKFVVFLDEPVQTRPLGELKVTTVKDKEQGKGGKVETKPSASEAKKTEEKGETVPEEKKKEEEEKDVDKMIGALKLSEDDKQGIYAKIKEMKDELEAKLQDRQKKLVEKLEAMKGKGKPGKKAK